MKTKISPSLICMDLCNLESGVRNLSDAGIDMLHVDLIDGYFSPSMPIGLDTIRDLRKKTAIPFDVHVMARDNRFFIEEVLSIGVQQLCFHYESEIHVDRQLNLIRKMGVRAGVALTPATPVSVLNYVIEKCDFVMLMLINPGFAFDESENQVKYIYRKIRDCREFIDSRHLNTAIEVDGRISVERIPDLIEAGADILVLGNTSLFSRDNHIQENLRQIKDAIAEGESRRKVK
jgi:ribulose-phosphate 3-epimerase